MNGFPVTYRGFDDVEYRAEYLPAEPERYRPSRYAIHRVDGQPLRVGTRIYPAGYIGGYGDHECESFLINLQVTPC